MAAENKKKLGFFFEFVLFPDAIILPHYKLAGGG